MTGTMQQHQPAVTHFAHPCHVYLCRLIQAGWESNDADLVAGLHSAAEDPAKGIKGAAVLLGVQLGNMHQQGTSGVACSDVLNNLGVLRASVQALNLHSMTRFVGRSVQQPV